MSTFTEKLNITQISKNEWQTGVAFIYYVGEKDSDDIIVVPKDFITDGASIPKFAWPIIGHPFGRYAQAAVLHDYLYRTHLKTKENSDNIFLEAMEVLEVPKHIRVTMYWCVRLFGKKAWNNGPTKYKASA